MSQLRVNDADGNQWPRRYCTSRPFKIIRLAYVRRGLLIVTRDGDRCGSTVCQPAIDACTEVGQAGFFQESITLLSWRQSVRYLSSAFSFIGKALTKRDFVFDLRALHHGCHSYELVICAD